jgi:transposase
MNGLMWAASTPRQHRHDGLRFASDLTGAGRAVIEPLLPPRAAAERPPRRPMREIVDAIFYALRSGIPWRMLPACFPPRQTVYGWFAAWREGGVWRSIVHHLGSVKTTEGGVLRGYDAGNEVLRRRRHAMVITDRRQLVLQVHPASIQDRDGAAPLLAAPFVEICSTTTSMECYRSISGAPAAIGPPSPCRRPGRKRTALAGSAGLFACRETALDRPWARRLFVCRQ